MIGCFVLTHTVASTQSLRPGDVPPDTSSGTLITDGADSNTFCSHTGFTDTCEIYPYVKFWKAKFNKNDCPKVSELVNR